MLGISNLRFEILDCALLPRLASYFARRAHEHSWGFQSPVSPWRSEHGVRRTRERVTSALPGGNCQLKMPIRD